MSDVDNIETPGEVLKDLIGHQRGRQAALARAVGVTPQTITKWINDQTGIPLDRWPTIEAFLGAAPLTFARRTGLTESIPDLETLPTDDTYAAAWIAAFPAHTYMTTRRRRNAERRTPAATPDVAAELSALRETVERLQQDLRDLAEVVARSTGAKARRPRGRDSVEQAR